MAMDIQKIEERIDKAAAGAVPISMEVGGVAFSTMSEVMEFAKMMAIAGNAVPTHLRGSPGTCLAICIQALEWRMSPFAVANKSYEVTNKGTTRIAYESQLTHAVIEARAPLKGRLRYEIIGEGDERRCKVWGTFKGETDPHVYISEPLGKLREARGRNEYGTIKGSPLWDTKPEVQLFYSASRDWCRLYAPDVLLGIYSEDEMEDAGFERVKDVTPPKPSFAQRMLEKRQKNSSGFDADRVATDADAAKPDQGNGPVIEGEVQHITDAPSISPANDEAAGQQPTDTTTTDTGAGDTEQKQSTSTERVKRSPRTSSRKAKDNEADTAGN